jgi:hypothetical protein
MWPIWSGSEKMKPFIYLIQSVSGTSYPEITGPSCDLIVLNRQELYLHGNLRDGSISAADLSWNEARNRLLWEALEQARTTGNDYLYYIFLDDDCILCEDQKLAGELGIPLTGNPFRTFERFLLEWEPAVGYTRNDRQHYDKGQAVNLRHGIDELFSAYHHETLSFLLPYYTGFDGESWLYSQHIINRMASLLYHSHRIQYNLVITTNTHRKDYGPRKKYWNIPITFLATALKPKLRQVLNTQVPNSPSPILDHPRKKNCSYSLSPSFIAGQWHTDHPLVRHRSLEDIKPRTKRTLQQQPARVAVCLSGSCRGLDRTYRNLQEKLLNPLAQYGDHDLFMYVPDDAEARYASLLKPTVLQVVPDHHLDEGGLRNGSDCLLKVGIQRYLQQLYGLKMCDRLRQAYEKENGFRYDAVLRCRPDLLFESPLPDLTTLDLNYIYVPDFHMFEGCNDRFAIGSSENMTFYMQKYDDWHAYVRNWISAGPEAPPVTAEMFTGGQLRQYGISVRLLPVRFDRVRPNKIESDWENHCRKIQNRTQHRRKKS